MLGYRLRRRGVTPPRQTVQVIERVDEGRANSTFAAICAVLAAWSIVAAVSNAPVLGSAAAAILGCNAILALRAADARHATSGRDPVREKAEPLMLDVCRRADVFADLLIVHGSLRSAAAIAFRNRRRAVSLSSDFAATMPSDELRAIIAHEIGHIAHGDLRFARLVGSLSAAIAGGVSVWIVLVLGSLVDYPLGFAAYLMVSLGFRTLLGLFNQPRELRADAFAAARVGDAVVVARALRTATAWSEVMQRRVLGPVPLRWILRVVAWKPMTHPSLHRRLQRLGVPHPPELPDSEAPDEEPAGITLPADVAP